MTLKKSKKILKIINEEDVEGTEESDNQGDNQITENYGAIPYVLTYCKLTNHTLTEALSTSVAQVFYIANYEVDRLEFERKNLKVK